jgi:hypothetical protein
MNRKEAGALLAFISEIWSNAPTADGATIDLWSETLSRTPFYLATLAIKKLLFTGTYYAPSLPEIIQTANDVVQKPLPASGEAYALVSKKLDGVYFYAEGMAPEVWAALHPIVRRTLEIIGVREFAMGDSAYIRPLFMKIYAQLLKQAKEEMMPESFKKELAAYRSQDQPELTERAEEVRKMIEGLAKEKGMNI